jgi:hypothetical protein
MKLQTKELPNCDVLDAWKKALSKRSGNRADKAHQVAVNNLMFVLDKKVLMVVAEHEEKKQDKDVTVSVSGGISTEAAVCGLRSIIAVLELEGLPVEPGYIRYRAKTS